MTLFGITGTIGAGKGTVVDYLVKEYGFHHASVSDFLASEAKRRGLVPDRIARRNVANDFRSTGPMGLMQAVYDEVRDKGYERIIIDPQHTVGEVQFIKNHGGKVFAVDADMDVRYERISKRGTEKDNVTYEEFVEQQTHEMQSDDPNKNNLGAAIKVADFTVKNNGNLEELHRQVYEILAHEGIVKND